MNEPKVGDFVWFTRTFRQMMWRTGMRRLPSLERPERYKVIQIVESKDGTLYQTKHGHFHKNWINKTVFLTEQEAKDSLETERQALLQGRERGVEE